MLHMALSLQYISQHTLALHISPGALLNVPMTF